MMEKPVSLSTHFSLMIFKDGSVATELTLNNNMAVKLTGQYGHAKICTSDQITLDL